ncbi:hypothetical protein QBC38DRAFT_479837 [Podospora fimiseda]|uniref:Extracellular membrane protein CFEM domain-containing protein n=1 Tax=Podospora fimiseda TaxID=252190 RepID=A0AAN7GTN3_9PEZI|nr:hypothetical protein QBC38DRAFT_479837 [Podospora fimiseda]
MISTRSVRVLPTALLALIFVSTSRAGTIDFGFYPKSTQECLYAAADTSRCESGSVSATNACLCRNGGNFVTDTASCLGRSSSSDLEAVYTTMEDACRNSNTPLNVSKESFMSSASSPTPSTPTNTSAPSEEKDKGDGKLSKGALAGIIVGAIAGAAVLGVAIFFLWTYTRKRREESHTMLPYEQPTQPGHMSLLPTLGDESTSYSSPPDTRSSSIRPYHRASGFNWESPHQLVYNAEADVSDTQNSACQSYSPVATSPPGLAVVELDSINTQPAAIYEVPAEMESSSVFHQNLRMSGQHYH